MTKRRKRDFISTRGILMGLNLRCANIKGPFSFLCDHLQSNECAAEIENTWKGFNIGWHFSLPLTSIPLLLLPLSCCPSPCSLTLSLSPCSYIPPCSRFLLSLILFFLYHSLRALCVSLSFPPFLLPSLTQSFTHSVLFLCYDSHVAI